MTFASACTDVAIAAYRPDDHHRYLEKNRSMKPAHSRSSVLRSVLIAVGLMVAPGVAQSRQIPVYAHAVSYGSGWECDVAFRESQGTCLAVEVPEHAYPTNVGYGSGWECEWGFTRKTKVCAAVEIPKGGFLNSSGDGWQCDRGFRQAGDACLEVKVPANAYLDGSAYGSGWTCNRGFTPDKDSCLTVSVPAHAFIDTSGTKWLCERGYKPMSGSCAPINVPKNAYLDYTGQDWVCERGFYKAGVSAIPGNVIGHTRNNPVPACVSRTRRLQPLGRQSRLQMRGSVGPVGIRACLPARADRRMQPASVYSRPTRQGARI